MAFAVNLLCMGNGVTFSKPRYGSVIHLHTAIYRFTLKRKKKDKKPHQ